MSAECASLVTDTPDVTAALATRLAARLEAGDVLLLSGGIGAGKTHFARAAIQALLGTAEDVPSPTFTLVQTYAAESVEVWHSDLYRLDGPEQVPELGLLEAFDTAICLVEWPDRLGGHTPQEALRLDFSAPDPANRPELREIAFSWTAPRWTKRLTEILDAAPE